MRRRVWLIAFAISAVSCGGGGSSDTPQPSDAPPPTAGDVPVGEGSYATIQAMMRDVESTFYLCTAPIQIYDPPLAERALAHADCSNTVTFFIYQPNDLQASLAEIQDSAEGGSAVLVGNNWIISCGSDEAVCTRIQGGTGGELVVRNP